MQPVLKACLTLAGRFGSLPTRPGIEWLGENHSTLGIDARPDLAPGRDPSFGICSDSS
jgi:hypothetical protein